MKININHLYKVEELPSKKSIRKDHVGYWNDRRYYRDSTQWFKAGNIIRGSVGKTHSEIYKRIKEFWAFQHGTTVQERIDYFVDYKLVEIDGENYLCDKYGRIDKRLHGIWDRYYFDWDNILRLDVAKETRREYRLRVGKAMERSMTRQEWYEKRSASRKANRELADSREYEFSLFVYLVNKPEHYEQYRLLKRSKAALQREYNEYKKEVEKSDRQPQPNRGSAEASWKRIYRSWAKESKEKWEAVADQLYTIRSGDHSVLDKLVKEEQIRKAREAERVERMNAERALKQAA